MTGSRTPLVAGNWKMHKTIAEARAFVEELVDLLPERPAAEVALCPPFTALHAAVEARGSAGLRVFAQTMHEEHLGAFTGEVSPAMLRELGVDGVVLGHSERRQLFGESDRALRAKVVSALDVGLRPMLCVGETEDERDGGDMERKLRHQVQEGLGGVPDERLAEVLIAYEPIWAIGTGRVATCEEAEEAIAFVRALVADRDGDQAERIRLLYGGSVKPENARELLSLPDVDGALVGGASLQPRPFAEIVAAAV